MNELFQRLGLNETESKVYRLLLSEKDLTAAAVAKKSGESRTNAYSVLEALVSHGVVDIDESRPVRRYFAKDPSELKEMIEQRKQELDQTKSMVDTALPDLLSVYNLAHHRPGVFHHEGISGYKKLLEDMTTANGDIWLLPTALGPNERESDKVLQMGLAKRKARGITTKVIVPEIGRDWNIAKNAGKKGFEVRFWGEPVEAEIIQYDDKVAFTVYKPKLINTIITDKVLAATLSTLFTGLWSVAKHRD